MPELLRASMLAGALALCLGAAASAAPGDAERAKAGTLLERGDGIGAEIALREAQSRGAPRAAVAAAMGAAWLEQGKRGKARDWLAKAEFAPGTEGFGLRMLGELERLDGDLPAAAKAYQQALQFIPKDAMLWVDIAHLRYASDEQVQAIEAVDTALALDPKHVRGLEFRGQLVRDRFGPIAALPWFEAGLMQAPRDVPLLGEYAATLGEAGRLKDMLVVTRQIIAIDPGNPRPWFLQAVLAARAGKGELARSLLERVKGDFRDRPAMQLLSGVLELDAGNLAVAIEMLDRLSDRQQANPRVQHLLARALYEARDFDGLIARFGARAARSDANPYLMSLVARAYEERGQRDLAARLLDRAALKGAAPYMPIAEADPPGFLAPRWTENPDKTGIAVAYARALLNAGQTGAAAMVAERTRALKPGSAEAQALAGDAQFALGRAVDATERYRAAGQVRLSGDLLLRWLGALDASRQPVEQGRLVVGYFAGNPADPLAARLMAGAAVQRGDWVRARQLLENLRARGFGRDVRLLCDLSLAQLRLGDDDAALDTAQAAYALQPASPVAAQALGMALAESGDAKPARSMLRKARGIAGSNPLLEQALRKAGGS